MLERAKEMQRILRKNRQRTQRTMAENEILVNYDLS